MRIEITYKSGDYWSGVGKLIGAGNYQIAILKKGGGVMFIDFTTIERMKVVPLTTEACLGAEAIRPILRDCGREEAAQYRADKAKLDALPKMKTETAASFDPLSRKGKELDPIDFAKQYWQAYDDIVDATISKDDGLIYTGMTMHRKGGWVPWLRHRRSDDARKDFIMDLVALFKRISSRQGNRKEEE